MKDSILTLSPYLVILCCEIIKYLLPEVLTSEVVYLCLNVPQYYGVFLYFRTMNFLIKLVAVLNPLISMFDFVVCGLPPQELKQQAYRSMSYLTYGNRLPASPPTRFYMFVVSSKYNSSVSNTSSL